MEFPGIVPGLRGTPYFAIIGRSRPRLSQLSRTSGKVSKDQKPSAEMSFSAGSSVASSPGRGNVPQVIQVWPIFSFRAGGFLANAFVNEGKAKVPKPRAAVLRSLRRCRIRSMVDPSELESYW